MKMFSAESLEEINIVVSNNPIREDPEDEVTLADLSNDDLKNFGTFEGEVTEGQKIKIKPEEKVPGQYVPIYIPNDDDVLAISDVKIFVAPRRPGK